MGRRRSNVIALQMKLQRLHRAKMKANLKPPFICPWCWHEKLILIQPKNKPYVFIYCSQCDKGEVLPKHDICSAIDYYCYLVDHLLGKTHTFKYETLNRRVYLEMKEKVTVGEIEVSLIRED